jgi:hypothetical protein
MAGMSGHGLHTELKLIAPDPLVIVITAEHPNSRGEEINVPFVR